MSSISILLSLFGEAPFLPGFIASLNRQTCKDFQLVYRIDGQAAVSPVTQLEDSRPLKLEDQTHYGAAMSYARLLNDAPDSDYCMLADQDDIWHPEKIEVSLAAMKHAEARYGTQTPILIHSDLRVVREDLSELSPSMARFQTLKPERKRLKDLMVQNNVTGCRVIINRSLKKIAGIPADAICHDWYLAMIAAALGHIEFINTPLVDYRQHSANVYGAVPRRLSLSLIHQRAKLHQRLQLTQIQAKAFLEQFRDVLNKEQIHLLEMWSGNLNEPRYYKRLFQTWRGGFAKNDWLRTLGMWWAL